MSEPISAEAYVNDLIHNYEAGVHDRLYRAVRFVDIAYAIVEYDPYADPYAHGSEAKEGMKNLLRILVRQVLAEQAGWEPGDELRAAAYLVFARLMNYCEEYPRSTT